MKFTYLLIADQKAELTQIAAISYHSDQSFNKYILPTLPISKKAQEITGLSTKKVGGKHVLCLNEKEVPSFDAKSALEEFCKWLKDLTTKENKNVKSILISHNARAFDMRHIT